MSAHSPWYMLKQHDASFANRRTGVDSSRFGNRLAAECRDLPTRPLNKSTLSDKHHDRFDFLEPKISNLWIFLAQVTKLDGK